MLTSRSIVAAARIANNASSRGKYFQPREDTPIAILNHATRPVVAQEKSPGMESLIGEIQRASEDHPGEMLSMSNHGEELRTLAKIVSDRMLNEVGHIRNVVNPMIRTIKGVVEERRSEIAGNNPLNMTLMQVVVQPIYLQDAMRAQIENYAGRNANKPDKKSGLEGRLLEDVNYENIFEILETPNPALNTAIQTLLTDVAASGILPIFGVTPKFGRELYTNYASVLSFLFLRALEAGKHPRFKMADFSTEERTYLARLKAFYGRDVELILTNIEQDLGDNRFYMGCDYDTGTIYVNDVKYRRWLEMKRDEGACMEAVIGALYRKNVALDLDMLYNMPSEAVKLYERGEALHKSNTRALTTKEVERVTERELVNYFVDTETDPGIRNERVAAVRDYFKDRANRLYTNESQDAFIERATCKLVGQGTDAYLIFTEMQTYLNAAENQDRNMSDAGAYAVVRLLMRWIACQVTCVDRPRYNNLSKIVTGKFEAQAQ